VHRLGIGGVLRRKPASTNPIESCLSTVQRVTRNVKRLREGDQPLRGPPPGFWKQKKKFRRIKGLSRNPVAEGKAESVSHSAEGGPDSRSCLNRGCYRSSDMEIVSPRAFWRGISSRKQKSAGEKKKGVLSKFDRTVESAYSAEHRESLQTTKTRTPSFLFSHGPFFGQRPTAFFLVAYLFANHLSREAGSSAPGNRPWSETISDTL